jgi:hypothetical protein
MRFEFVGVRFIIYASSEMVYDFSDSSSYFSYVLSAVYGGFILISKIDVVGANRLKVYDTLSGVERIVEASYILKTGNGIDRNDRRREILFALPNIAVPQGEDILAGFHRMEVKGEEGPTTTGALNLIEQMPMSLL